MGINTPTAHKHNFLPPWGSVGNGNGDFSARLSPFCGWGFHEEIKGVRGPNGGVPSPFPLASLPLTLLPSLRHPTLYPPVPQYLQNVGICKISSLSVLVPAAGHRGEMEAFGWLAGWLGLSSGGPTHRKRLERGPQLHEVGEGGS